MNWGLVMNELESIKSNLDDVIKVQCYHGNYNANPYMFGLANGLILARSIITGEMPEYMDAPKQYLDDLPKPELVLCKEVEASND